MVSIWRYGGLVIEAEGFEEGLKIKAVENKKKNYLRLYVHREEGRHLEPVVFITLIKP